MMKVNAQRWVDQTADYSEHILLHIRLFAIGSAGMYAFLEIHGVDRCELASQDAQSCIHQHCMLQPTSRKHTIRHCYQCSVTRFTEGDCIPPASKYAARDSCSSSRFCVTSPEKARHQGWDSNE